VLNAMDKLLVLRNGRVEAFGPPSEVLVRLVRPSNPRALAPSSNDTSTSQSPSTQRAVSKEAAQ
jgi:ABC-type protease/lipase transport system fused ATPase/permease subunit